MFSVGVSLFILFCYYFQLFYNSDPQLTSIKKKMSIKYTIKCNTYIFFAWMAEGAVSSMHAVAQGSILGRLD